MKVLALFLSLGLTLSLNAQDTPEQEIAQLKQQVLELKAALEKQKKMADLSSESAEVWLKAATKARAEAKELAEASEKNFQAAQEWKVYAQRLESTTLVPGAKTTTISGSGGVYTTHGAGGTSTLIQTAPGHYEIRHADGTTQRVIKTTP